MRIKIHVDIYLNENIFHLFNSGNQMILIKVLNEKLNQLTKGLKKESR